ncbi:MAG: hypothetical protein ACKOAY_00680 [Haliscomenobacter sp.]
MKQIKFLRIRFQPTIQAAELPKFRGAVIQAVEQSHLLFHNHQGDAFRYLRWVNSCLLLLSGGYAKFQRQYRISTFRLTKTSKRPI